MVHVRCFIAFLITTDAKWRFAPPTTIKYIYLELNVVTIVHLLTFKIVYLLFL